MSIRGELWVERLGVMPYAPALDFQREVARARIAGTISEDVLLLVEHPPVVTLGRSAKKQHLLASPELLAARGVEQFEVERGGDVTFHGPGQLVGYPIIDLKRHRRDLHWYLRQVEEALIVALADFGIAGERSQGQTGVWTRGRKIASIGVHARDWVTWHGFALNVTTDLSYFDLMVPCGIQSVVMTSISREIREMGSDSISREMESDPISMKQVEASVVEAFGSVFELAPRDVAHLLGEAITPV
jgi:lipoyl(octanoyl) transferase